MPVASDLSTTRDIAATTAAISGSAIRRSSHDDARLKKIHQMRTATPPANPPMTPLAAESGTTSGIANRTSH